MLVCGTPEYVPPEVLQFKSWGAQTLDRYALGVLIYRMLYGYTPFDDENAKNVFFNVLTSKISFPKILAADDAVDISEDARSLILSLTNPDPARRLPFQEIKDHAWFAGIDWEDVINRKLEPPYKPESLEGGYASRPIPLL